MEPVIVRNVKIGEGMPKICIPIVGKTEEDILYTAETMSKLPKDLVEWRADCFQDVCDIGKVNTVLCRLRDVLGEIPILFTFRTTNEGGEKEISLDMYQKINRAAIESGFVDLLDVEMFGDSETVGHLISYAHSNYVKVVGSNHEFEITPPREELVSRFSKMQSMGADILKIAVMPQSKEDVLTLMAAAEVMTTKLAHCPVVAISMSKEGMISRVIGEVFGSAITFGTTGENSAPGQIPATELKEALNMLHHLL